MKKILWICLILWALGMCGEQAQARDIVEKWRCFGQYDFDKKEVVIELEGRIPAGEEWGPGQIWVRGIGQDGGFTIRGVNWWWEWMEDNTDLLSTQMGRAAITILRGVETYGCCQARHTTVCRPEVCSSATAGGVRDCIHRGDSMCLRWRVSVQFQYLDRP